MLAGLAAAPHQPAPNLTPYLAQQQEQHQQPLAVHSDTQLQSADLLPVQPSQAAAETPAPRTQYASPYVTQVAINATHGFPVAHQPGTTNLAFDPSQPEFGAAAQNSQHMTQQNPGSWSQSKTWMSQEATDRAAFSRLMTNLHHIGVDKSPFIPQSPSEMAAHKAAFAEDRRKELEATLRQRENTAERRKHSGLTKEEQEQADVKVGPLFGGRQLSAAFSPVLGAPNCFNNNDPTPEHLRADWPTMAEYKEAPVGRYGRALPVPRMNVVDPGYAQAHPDAVYNPDGTIRWQAKLPVPNSHLLLPTSPPEEW
ncbi:hypothetical protein JDV02_006345 [Purpureocillium takamizusanense]|uniref:Uncharacterized protein n=1 Tax=Purpureocillium takamizusanense TaxID=2060973 RepID=A0A9Q8VB87_9HYPO|nr:uncharacterized protein JDV02_006345 [Purpureocillium takamizusanense]UNI20240.1 hypothetical protein JDV02_006345 [Purpureocillium takamizusanense]